jgi:ribose/xylose/arabinose/galactoside ABC-type transport system permease subunit
MNLRLTGFFSDRRSWPCLLLLLLLLINMVITPQFFYLEIRDGRLYGSLIDVLNRGAPVALLAIGMSLVIATRGIDLSVGSVMAIAGAVCANLIVAGVNAAHRRHIDPDGGRPRHRAIDKRRPDHHLPA